jgi:hypothetical protein
MAQRQTLLVAMLVLLLAMPMAAEAARLGGGGGHFGGGGMHIGAAPTHFGAPHIGGFNIGAPHLGGALSAPHVSGAFGLPHAGGAPVGAIAGGGLLTGEFRLGAGAADAAIGAERALRPHPMPNAQELRIERVAGSQNIHAWQRWRRFPGFYGWAGPLFWPYAYDAIYDDVFWPGLGYYDSFWYYGYGDLYGALFSPFGYNELAGFLPGYIVSGSTVAERLRQMCGEDSRQIAGWPIDRVAKLVQPNADQRPLLDDLANASQKAAEIIRAACPTTAALTPAGRLAAMQTRIEAMIQAVDTVRMPLVRFYDSLTDEQKARLVAAKPPTSQVAPARTPLSQNCNAANPVAQWPQADIEKALRPSPEQQAKLDALKEAAAKAAEAIASSCPGELPMTPPARLDAVTKRLATMLEAIKTVRPALEDFYASLSDEQKAQLNFIGQPGTARR